jgi:hypothetical protein
LIILNQIRKSVIKYDLHINQRPSQGKARPSRAQGKARPSRAQGKARPSRAQGKARPSRAQGKARPSRAQGKKVCPVIPFSVRKGYRLVK